MDAGVGIMFFIAFGCLAFGCLAFAFLYIFDLNKLIFIHKICCVCFAVGIVLLTAATAGILVTDSVYFQLPFLFRIVFGALSFISLVLLIYSLFFALPFTKTYVKAEKNNKVVDAGAYALCRHPGVICFFFFYFFLWLVSGKMLVMWACLIWTMIDILHVYLQDRWFFPKILNNYNVYKREVPFLIPTRSSFKQCLATLPKGVLNDFKP